MRSYFMLMALAAPVTSCAARPPAPVQPEVAAAPDARSLIESCLAAHGPVLGHPPLALLYRGTHLDAGHYAKPRELRDYALEQRVRFGFDGTFLVRAEITREADHCPGGIELTPESLYWLDYCESVPAQDSERDRVTQRYRLAALIPSLYLSLALSERAAPQYLGIRVRVGQRVIAVGFTDSLGLPHTLYIEPASHQLVAVDHSLADPVFGDDVQTTEYLTQQTFDGLLVPVALRRSRLWFVEDELRCEGPVELSAAAMRAPTRAPAQPSERVTVQPIARGLFELRLEHLDNRVLFQVLADHVNVFEAPLNSATGELILREVERVSQGKPVRRLFLSHHHPDYVGGIRPFVARGVTLVTTPGNVAYLEQIAQAARTLEPDAQAIAKRPALIEAVQGARKFESGAEAFDVHDIGSYTGHTDEYLVYHFASERLLFQGDCASVRQGAELAAASPRAVGLLEAVDALHLDVDRIFASWPLHERAPMLSLSMLRQMVQLRRQLANRADPP